MAAAACVGLSRLRYFPTPPPDLPMVVSRTLSAPSLTPTSSYHRRLFLCSGSLRAGRALSLCLLREFLETRGPNLVVLERISVDIWPYNNGQCSYESGTYITTSVNLTGLTGWSVSGLSHLCVGVFQVCRGYHLPVCQKPYVSCRSAAPARKLYRTVNYEELVWRDLREKADVAKLGRGL